MYADALPVVPLRRKKQGVAVVVFDPFRKKWVPNTPEEWVRQQLLNFLTHQAGYPFGRMAVEMAIDVNHQALRCDAVLFSTTGTPALIIECKAPNVPLNSKVADQAMVYNRALDTGALLLSNGLSHLTVVFQGSDIRTFQGLLTYRELSLLLGVEQL